MLKVKTQKRTKIIYVADSRVAYGVLWSRVFVLGRRYISSPVILGKGVNDNTYNLKVGSREGRIRKMPLLLIEEMEQDHVRRGD